MRTSSLTLGSVYIYKVAKSFGFRFGQKNKPKQKDFAMCVT